MGHCSAVYGGVYQAAAEISSGRLLWLSTRNFRIRPRVHDLKWAKISIQTFSQLKQKFKRRLNPPKTKIAPENRSPGRGDSYWKPIIFGVFILVFQGCRLRCVKIFINKSTNIVGFLGVTQARLIWTKRQSGWSDMTRGITREEQQITFQSTCYTRICLG